MNRLIYRHFGVLEKFISEFKEGEASRLIAVGKRQRDKAEYKMDLVIFNFEIYTSKYPEIYNFFLGEFQDEFKRREEWDRLRSRENFATYLKQLLNSVSMQTV